MNAALNTAPATETTCTDDMFDMFADAPRSELEAAAHAVEQARLAREFRLAQKRALRAGTLRGAKG